MEDNQQKSNGALIGSFIVILILIIGGLYLMKTQVSQAPEGDSTGIQAEDGISESDEVLDLEAELESTSDFDSLEEGLE